MPIKRKVNVKIMCKKVLTLFLCTFLVLPLSACSIIQPQNPSADVSETQTPADERVTTEEESSQEALLGPDATDKELLDALGDDINIVADDAFEQTVSAFSENIDEFAGQLYQLEGTYTIDNENSYISKTSADNGDGTVSRLPLIYVTKEPEDGEKIRVTGVVNEGEIDGKTVAVLEVVVIELLNGE